MNKKLVTSIGVVLALLLVGPVWADGEDDELEVTIQMIDNPEEVSNSFIIVLGADDSAAGEGDGGDRGESGQESNEGDHGDGDLLAGVDGDHGDGDVLDGDEGLRDGGDGDHNGGDEGVSDGDRFASDLRADEGFDLVDDNDASDTMDEGDVTEDQERHPEEGNGDDGMTDETVGDEVADATDGDVATDEETDNPDEQTDLVE